MFKMTGRYPITFEVTPNQDFKIGNRLNFCRGKN